MKTSSNLLTSSLSLPQNTTSITALVVDDDNESVCAIGDILDSLGHECEYAGDQQSARRLLATNAYAYVLLGLKIPVRPGRLRRIENGKNLLRQIRETHGMENLPVIVTNTNGSDALHLAVSTMKAGATDYITKPFRDGALDKAIHNALAKVEHARATLPRIIATAHGHVEPVRAFDRPKTPQPFMGGEMDFSPKGVKLCGTVVIGDTGLGHCRRMLELLRRKRKDGRFVRISGEGIARSIGEKIHADVGVGTITGCAKTIRTNIRKRLLRDLNLVCQDQDVLARDEQGYHLNDTKITVREMKNDESADVPANDPSNVPGDKNVPSIVPSNVPGLNERQRWIIEEVRKDHKVQRSQLVGKFNVSEKTAKRDFSELVKHGHIEYVRKPHPGFYRRKE